MVEMLIDPEFRDNNPPLSEEEFALLEENILQAGRITDPIYTWHGFIVDGHNRYKILQAHPELDGKFRTVSLDEEIADKDSAIIWICRHQLGRRNLTPEQRTDLIGRQYKAEKRLHGGTGANRFVGKVQSTTSRHSVHGKTRDKLAQEYGVGHTFVQYADEFVDGLDAMEKEVPGVRAKVLSGQAKVSKKQVRAARKMEPEERKKVAEAILHDEPLPKPTPLPVVEPSPEPEELVEPEPIDEPEEMETEPEPVVEPASMTQKDTIQLVKAIKTKMYDLEDIPEYGVEDLIAELRSNAESYISILRHSLTMHSNLLTEAGAGKIRQVIKEYIIDEIEKVKENLK